MKGQGARPFEQDDGRTIADMSGISRQPLFLPRLPGRAGRPGGAGHLPGPGAPSGAPMPPPAAGAARPQPWVDDAPSREEQLWAMLGAMKAALLVGGVFVAGLGLVVLLFVLSA